jgi:hypothetical protein
MSRIIDLINIVVIHYFTFISCFNDSPTVTINTPTTTVNVWNYERLVIVVPNVVERWLFNNSLVARFDFDSNRYESNMSTINITANADATDSLLILNGVTRHNSGVYQASAANIAYDIIISVYGKIEQQVVHSQYSFNLRLS